MHLEAIQQNATDQAWLAIYKLVFRSKALSGLTDDYFELVTALDQFEIKLDPSSPVLAHIFCEKALSLDIQHKTDEATVYYLRAIQQSRDYPFLKFTRFYCFLKLAMIEAQQRHFDAAQAYLARAEAETNRADTLRSRYHLNLYRSFLLHAKNDNDSAYALLKKAYAQDFQLDFRRNTLEINRLTVELETREKENANLRLQRDRGWLLAGVIVAGFMAVATYLTLVNYKGKAKIQLHQQEVATMKLEKQLKDLELASIDQMLEGQEKERQQIANELHDDLGSLLTTVKLHFDHLKTKTESAIQEDTSSLFQKTATLLDEVYQKVRTLAHVRNTGVNPNEGLLAALRSYAAKVSLANQLVIEIETHGLETRLDNSLEITIFRIIQELITNVIKHAQATEVTVHLTPHDDVLNVMVEDNGRGFDVSQIKRGATMGLYSIQKRIENAGGSVFIDSIPNKGTTVIIDIPLT
jgi:signal transduction histidine kinase